MITDTNSIFNTDNVIEEEMIGVTIKNDEYHLGKPVDLDDKIKDFQSLSDTVTLMKSSIPEAETTNTVISKNTDTRTSKNTIEAVIGIVSAVNEFGLYIKKGSRCPVCGKTVLFMPANGYCSLECAGKDLLKKLTSTLTGDYEVETSEIITLLLNVLEFFNIALNVISKFPDILSSIASFPPEYKDYATVKLNIVFLNIKRIINELLILKNELLIKLLRRIKFGTIDTKLQPVFSVINTILKTAQALKESLDNALSVAYNAIKSVSGFFYIGPLEYGFFMTAKSMLALCPYFKTNPKNYPPGLLGRPFWGMGTMNIAFDMTRCLFGVDIGLFSALLNVDFKKVNNIVRKIFRPITAPEYLMDPELFEMRLVLSDLNSGAIEKLIKILLKTVVVGGDFVPTYENLSLTNIWFDIAILTCWGPWTKSIYGDFIFHGFI